MPVQIGDMILYSTEELAEKFHLHVVTIRRLLEAGALKGQKLGRRWYVSEGALKDYFRPA